MRRLILLRHAKTERRAGSGRDFDRALTVRGHDDAAEAGRALAAAGLTPDVALVSTAVRARQTFEAAQPALADARLELRPELYDASPETLWRAAEAADGDTVLLVAHNPGVHMLAQSLAAEALTDAAATARLAQGFPTATAAAFVFTDGRTACLGVFPVRNAEP